MNMKRTLSTTAAIALSVGLLAGCATTGQLEELKAEVAKANEKAEMAASSANKAADASTVAQDALNTANSAKERADAAMDAANAARRAADDCKERCERVLQKAMAK